MRCPAFGKACMARWKKLRFGKETFCACCRMAGAAKAPSPCGICMTSAHMTDRCPVCRAPESKRFPAAAMPVN